MENKAHERYKWLCLQMEEDEELLHLREKLRQAQPDFLAAMEAMPPDLRQNITEFVGILAEISDRITETAAMCRKLSFTFASWHRTKASLV